MDFIWILIAMPVFAGLYTISCIIRDRVAARKKYPRSSH